MDAVDPQFVVQVRAGGKAGGSDVADGLAGADRRANRCPLGKAAHVRIKRAVMLAMRDFNDVAVAAFAALEDDFPSPAALMAVPAGAA